MIVIKLNNKAAFALSVLVGLFLLHMVTQEAVLNDMWTRTRGLYFHLVQAPLEAAVSAGRTAATAVTGE